MKIVIAGHVDHGKSTLLGRILTDTGQVFPEKIEKIKKNCQKNGKNFEYAFILDAFEEEQNQGITIDKTEIPWSYKDKKIIFIDTPGHREFLKNMISGASTADAAIVMIDALEGVREQFKLHSYTLNLLGIKTIVVVVNKMDLVNYSEKRFLELANEINQIYSEYKITSQYVIPVSAFHGENLLESSTIMPWYLGMNLGDALLEISTKEKKENSNLRIALQDTYKFDDKRIYVGKVESGVLAVGNRIKFLPSGSSSIINTIEEWNVSTNPISADLNTAVGFTLKDKLYLNRGEVGFIETDAMPALTYQVQASVFWLGKSPLDKNKNYKFKLLTQETNCKFETIFNVFNSSESENSLKDSSFLKQGEAAEVIIKFQKNIVCDSFVEFANTGRFVILENSQVVGGGVILDSNTLKTFKEESHLDISERSKKFGHTGAVIWLTGLPSSGKSTLAKKLEEKFFDKNIHTLILDGDNLRKGLNVDLGFSPEDRKENIRRVAEVANLVASSGVVVIAALISPKESDREYARNICKDNNFFEVFISCSLEECEKRDPKGLYKKARNGEIHGFTGVDAIYETPKKPDLVINTQTSSPQEAVLVILKYLSLKSILGEKKW